MTLHYLTVHYYERDDFGKVICSKKEYKRVCGCMSEVISCLRRLPSKWYILDFEMHQS